jgi:hypothetical protein
VGQSAFQVLEIRGEKFQIDPLPCVLFYVSSIENFMVRNTYNFLKGRANSQFQLTTDELRAHLDAVEQTFGIDIDLAQLVKKYKSDESRTCQASRLSAASQETPRKRRLSRR